METKAKEENLEELQERRKKVWKDLNEHLNKSQEICLLEQIIHAWRSKRIQLETLWQDTDYECAQLDGRVKVFPVMAKREYHRRKLLPGTLDWDIVHFDECSLSRQEEIIRLLKTKAIGGGK